MSNIKQLQDQKVELAAEARVTKKQLLAVLDAGAKNGDGKLDDKQEAQAASLRALMEDVKTRVDANAKAISLAEERAELERGEAISGTTPDANVQADAAARVTVHEKWRDDPKLGFKNPREFFLGVMHTTQGRSGLVKNGHQEALRELKAAAGSDEQSTFSDPYGGFAIPAAFSPNMLMVQAEGDPTVGRVTSVPMTTGQVDIPARTDKDHRTSVSGGLRFYRNAEADTVAASRLKGEMVSLKANDMMGIAFATAQLLQDSPISFAALIEAGFRDEFGAKILSEKLGGTGVGEYAGVLNAPCTIEIAKESSQVADTIVRKNLVKMRARCWGYGNAIWLANHDTLPTLSELNFEAGTSAIPVWWPSMREGEPDMLLGRPLFFTEFAETVGDAGDIILGDWGQYLEGIRQGVQRDESIHVRFVNNENAFRFTARNDGAPWWKTAITPRKGAGTLSPFVTLAARA